MVIINKSGKYILKQAFILIDNKLKYKKKVIPVGNNRIIFFLLFISLSINIKACNKY